MIPLNSVRVRVAHTTPLVSAGLLSVLGQRGQIHIVGENEAADIVIADYCSGMAQAQHGQRNGPRVLIVTPAGKELQVSSAFASGVSGYLMQDCSADELVQAIHHLRQGLRYLCPQLQGCMSAVRDCDHLTGREHDVLQLLATGQCNKEIARALGIGVGTVKSHLKGVMSKLGARARTHAVVLAAERGLVEQGAALH